MSDPNAKPEWWPQCPYPEDIFPMKRERYAEIVPDPDIRTALSGMLGRIFREMASDMIWESYQNWLEDNEEKNYEHENLGL